MTLDSAYPARDSRMLGEDAAFPAAPWRLRGEMYGTLLRLPRGAVPADLLPSHVDITRRDGSVVAAVAWAEYMSGSVLEYRELMVVAMTKLTLPLTGTVLRIWVDSPQSMAGGRQLWCIPKEMASFGFDHSDGFTGSIAAGGREPAAFRFVPKWTLPGRWPAMMVVRQDTPTGLRRTTSVMRGRMQVGDGKLDLPEHGELAFLDRGKPIAHLAIRGFRAEFGRRSVEMPPAR
jgi:hypothetical protein